MEVLLHKFPTIEDGLQQVEEVYCMLLNKFRSGDNLDSEVIDWLDYANNVLEANSWIS